MRDLVQAVLFDMDGLMIDTEKYYWAAHRQIAAEHGKSVSDQTLGRMMGRSPIDSATVYATETGILLPPAEILVQRDRLVIAMMRQRVDPMPHLLDILPMLARTFRLGIVTSATRPFVDVMLDSLGIRALFAALQTSEGIKNGKPDPEIYLSAMAKLGVSPRESAVLEDSSNGALAGKRSGALTIAVPSEHTASQDFRFVDYVARDLLDAAKFILSHAGRDNSGERA
ncbi:MAG TPA: HAD family phosphatase [Tepidisphaeraceae bacterium]|jgi:HAD superfamily hydrolase (TIGR01509 family)|nr:HAD family phosphatase [Tepidisphaeraceae bacterium]